MRLGSADGAAVDGKRRFCIVVGARYWVAQRHANRAVALDELGGSIWATALGKIEKFLAVTCRADTGFPGSSRPQKVDLSRPTARTRMVEIGASRSLRSVAAKVA